MRYADSLLADGERVALRRRQHWLAVVLEGREALALVGFGIVLLIGAIALDPPAGVLRDLLGLATALLVGLGLLWFAVRLWRWWAQDYLVTNRRVIKVEGIFNKRAADSSLEKVNDAVLAENVVGRLLGYGDLTILTAAEAEIDLFTMLAGAREFKREMLEQKHALELELSGPLGATPPLRADELTRERATELLARLADLRDRGAISAAEFDAKKRELLERI
jgi:uncharacterized membrane protein YdbT with pleckstrin-like domain